jgi:hypothetical protein
MARGSYIIIPITAYDSAVPLVVAQRWNFTTSNEGGEPQFVHPTWRQAVELGIQSQYGVPREFDYPPSGGQRYVLLEFSLSGGLTDDIEALQSSDPAAVADFQILTVTEARNILNGVDIFE